MPGTSGDDTINGLGGNDTLDGDNGDDLLDGGEGSDLLLGGIGEDTLIGGDGDDTLQPFAPGPLELREPYGTNGLLDGGNGVDRVYLHGYAIDVYYNEQDPSSDFGLLVSPNEYLGYILIPMIDVEIIEFVSEGVDPSTTFQVAAGGLGDDALTSSFGLDFVAYSGDGADTLTGGAGFDSLNAGDGEDILFGHDGADTLIGGEGADTISGGAGADTFLFKSIAEVSTTSDVIDDFEIGDVIDLDVSGLTFIGTAAFSSAAGEYRFETGGGHTFIEFDEDGDGSADRFIALTNGEFALRTAYDKTPILEVTVVAPSTNGDDYIRGTIGDDFLEGLAGDDSLLGTLGNDTLVGGDGVDGVYGAEGEDLLFGDNGDDWIKGGDGDDTLSGGAGADLFRWSGISELGVIAEVVTDLEANDILDFHVIDIYAQVMDPAGLDLICIGTSNFSGAVGEYRYQKISGQTEIQFDADGDGGADYFVILSNGEFDLTGDDSGYVSRNVSAATALGDSIMGSQGADMIDGLGGDDTLDGSWGDDVLSGADGEDLLLGGDDDDIVSGGDGADTIYGGAGLDTLSGEGGDDTMFGGDGNDTLSGEQGRDLIYGDDGADTLHGFGSHDTLYGGNGDDDLRGGHGKDLLGGSGGNDVLRGFDGDDRLFGGGNHDTLIGNEGNDSLIGGGGNDRLKGDDGDDTLYGSYGNDTVTGGTGDDVFQFRKTHDADTIDDFTAGAGTEDAIQLLAFGASFDTFAEVIAAASQVGADTVIDFGGGDTLTLVGVAPGDLHEDDFIFG
ncbi:MAG: calcium-binding protein [Parvularculaceae bacterium]